MLTNKFMRNQKIHFLALTITVLLLFTVISCKTDSKIDPIISISDFIKNNPDRSSFTLIRNDSIKAQLRQDKKFPLASTLKIIVAIEFSKQVASGNINPTELIDIADLDLYYLPKTDGDAHPDWKKNAIERNELKNNQVSLQEVAKGMVWFSSNANTEYLMDKLGLDNINANLKELNLTNHGNLFPIVASLFFYSNINKADLKEKISKLTQKDLENEYLALHLKLKADKDGSFKKQIKNRDLEIQKIWSDRLPASTTKEYAALMQKILSGTYYSTTVHKQLDIILQPILELAPTNKTVYDFAYNKGGSTAFVLTMAVGTKTKKGAKTTMAVFFNDLTIDENEQLQALLNTFLVNCTQGDKYKSIIEGL
jgi:D-alanyl-D-alanine carboxypeptidase